MQDLARLSLNQKTTDGWSVREAVAGCVNAGIPWIGLWRDKVADAGLAESAKITRDAGVRVSSLCRGGAFPAATAAERSARIADNRRAIDEAAALGTDVLVLVCGAAPDKDIDAARHMVAEGIAAVAPYAAERGIRLGIEPLHPAFAADRSVITTLAEALDLAEHLGAPNVGIALDTYHVWWDPQLLPQIARAGGRIFAFHVNDWPASVTNVLVGRQMMGDGVIDIPRIRAAVERAGYTGPIEVEIFNETLWATPGDAVLAQLCQRYRAFV